MEHNEIPRRALLQAILAGLGATALPIGWDDLAAAHEAHHNASDRADAAPPFFSAADAADVDAVAAQIVPTDDTPGAREAGVITFIDRSLGTCLARLADVYRAALADFQAACRAAHPGVASFASLTSEQQIAFLKTVDHTPFFELTRLLTLLGLFTAPIYGGNRNGIGWKLIGFEDQHAFVPPFGYYDRDYPGFGSGTTSGK
jgi:Gluconate 2-dehydrogenase subunit 3